MTSGGIYLVGEAGLTELTETPYDTEDVLQTFLADYPKLLAGEQIDPDTPRRWVLVRREASVSDRPDGASRWSLDHLFLDQDGVPTLVEVKRSSDTRIRREVVGQMLDYAANAVVHWPVEKLITEFEATCDSLGLDPEYVIGDLVAAETSVDDFWHQVKTNLQAGRIRMMFVADVIPPELRRIVEFLNEQLDPAEVYAVEVRRFAGREVTALVPRLVGATSDAQRRKEVASTSRRRWTEAAYLEKVGETLGRSATEAVEEILAWARAHGARIAWGTGNTGSMQVKYDHEETVYNLFNVYVDGRLELPFGSLRPPYHTTEARVRLLHRLNEALGGAIPEDAAERFPQVSADPLLREPTRSDFLTAWESVIRSVVDNRPGGDSGTE